MVETITGKRTVKVQVNTKTVTKSVTKVETVVLAGASYDLAKGKTKTIELAQTPLGALELATAARQPLREKLIATVRGGSDTTKVVIVS